MKSTRVLLPAALLALGTACAAVQVAPSSGVIASQASIRAAEEVGAGKDPRAALHLRLAKEQYAFAQRLLQEGEEDHARVVLMRSDADAELALALAKRGVARANARQSEQQLKSMETTPAPRPTTP